MGKRVRVLSKNMFDSILPRMKIDDLNVEYQHNLAFISIRNSDMPDMSYFKKNHTNVLNLVFDDETKEGNDLRVKSGIRESQLFTREQAKQIIDFVEMNKNVDIIYVHCLAGQSRSGAVGLFINDIWGEQSYYDFAQSNPIIKPNFFIVALLRRVYNNIEEDYGDK